VAYGDHSQPPSIVSVWPRASKAAAQARTEGPDVLPETGSGTLLGVDGGEAGEQD